MLLPHHLVSPATDLDDPSLYINRELSWLQFNWRVLEEALDERHPLLERVKFLAIFATNLDEFFMIRVSGLRRQVTGGVLEVPPDGMTPSEQLAAIHQTLTIHLARAGGLLATRPGAEANRPVSGSSATRTYSRDNGPSCSGILRVKCYRSSHRSPLIPRTRFRISRISALI
jgi:hypothetical protein